MYARTKRSQDVPAHLPTQPPKTGAAVSAIQRLRLDAAELAASGRDGRAGVSQGGPDRTRLQTGRIGGKPLQTKRFHGAVVQRVRTYVIEDMPFFGNRPKTTFLTGAAGRLDTRKYLRSLPPAALGGRNINTIVTDREQGIIHGSLLGRTPVAEFHQTVLPGGVAPLGQAEPLILKSHGAPPSTMFFGLLRVAPSYGGYSPTQLARHIWNSGLLPINYAGQIYISGCNTARGLVSMYDGTSFIAQFKVALQALATAAHPLGAFTVKGDLGTARTGNDGRVRIDVTNENRAEIDGKSVLMDARPGHPRKFTNAMGAPGPGLGANYTHSVIPHWYGNETLDQIHGKAAKHVV